MTNIRTQILTTEPETKSIEELMEDDQEWIHLVHRILLEYGFPPVALCGSLAEGMEVVDADKSPYPKCPDCYRIARELGYNV